MPPQPQETEWVTRVLGVKLRPVGPRPMPGTAINTRVVKLADALREFDDPDLERIADEGLFGLGRGENVALMKAMIEYDAAGTERRAAAAKQLRTAVDGYRRVLAHPFAALVDDNPLHIPIGLRTTLGAALDQIAGALP
jgi:hypothetical protein